MKNSFLQTLARSINIFILILLSLSLLACSSEKNEETVDEETSLTEAENILLLVNKARLEEGLNVLTLNSALNQAAYEHSLDMNTNDYFNHIGLNGSTFSERVSDAGYTGFAFGENIAIGQQNAAGAHSSWMKSDGHRANILKSNVTEMGLGFSGVYWTQIFGQGK